MSSGNTKHLQNELHLITLFGKWGDKCRCIGTWLLGWKGPSQSAEEPQSLQMQWEEHSFHQWVYGGHEENLLGDTGGGAVMLRHEGGKSVTECIQSGQMVCLGVPLG